MKHLLHAVCAASVLAVSSISGLACAETPPAPAKTIKIVSSLPRTGSANAQTTTIVNGIQLAIEEQHNQVAGMQVVYEDWDDASPERGAWDPVIEGANAERAISDAAVVAYIGPYNSGATKISSPKLNRAGLVQVSPGASWPGLTKPGLGEPGEPKIYRPSGKVTFFRVVPADDIQGPAAVLWAKALGTTKMFVLHDRELYGKGIADIVQKTAKKVGIEVVGFEGIDAKASNYKSLVVKMKQSGADLIYFGGTTQSNAGQLAKDIRSGGITAKLMVPDGCFEDAFITAAGAENLNGNTYLTFSGVPAKLLTGKGAAFYETYKARFKSEPEVYSVYGYETARVILDAIQRANSADRDAILQALAKTSHYEGALGTWSFDENGDTTLKTLSGNTVKDGHFEFVRMLDGQ